MKTNKVCINKNHLILFLIAAIVIAIAIPLSNLGDKKNITSTKANETKQGTTTLSLKPDGSFGNNGIKIYDDQAIQSIVETSSEYIAAYQNDGKILVMAKEKFGGNIIRLMPNGQLDTSFGNSGVADTGLWRLNAMLLLPDGKILVSGDEVHTEVNNSVLRLNSNGSKDVSFEKIDLKKYAQQDVIAASAFNLYAFDLQAEGDSYKIIAVGKLTLENPKNGVGKSHCYIVRFNKDGSVDKSFGVQGEIVTEFTSGASSGATAVKVQQDGRIVVAGYDISGAQKFGLLRLAKNGGYVLDSGNESGETFRKTIDMRANSISMPAGIVIQKSGKIVMGGTVTPSGSSEYFHALVRFNTDGTIDPTFGGNNDGKLLYPVNYADNLYIFPRMKSIRVLQNDEILFASSYALQTPDAPTGTPANAEDFALTLLTADGVPSKTGSNGTTFTNVSANNPSQDRLDSIDVSPAGKVLAIGISHTRYSSPSLEAAQYILANSYIYLPQINH